MRTKKTHQILIVLSLFFLFESAFSQDYVLQGIWETVKTINRPLARHENSFVCVKNKFYLLGGRGVKPISIYDVNTNTWSEGAKPPFEIHHFQAVVYKGNIYIFGAMTGKYPYETPLSHSLIYNPKKNIWSEGPEIPKERRRGSAGVVVKKNIAYIISGIVDGHNSTHVPWVDAYNFKTKKWTALRDAPRTRDHFHAAINNGKIYAVGGRNSSYATQQTFELTIPEVDVYDIKTNSWSTLPKRNNIQIERAGASCVFFGNDLILIGGESITQNEAHNEVDSYNLKTKVWRKLNNLNGGRHGSQAIVYKKSIYIVAGSGNRGGRPELDTMEKFSIKK
jgi:N-acetylneuraminic acid mutarotase